MIGLGYVYLSLGLTAVLFLYLLVSDIRMYFHPMKNRSNKFGYCLFPNIGWSMVWGLGWWFLLASLPGFNIIAILSVLYIWWDERVEKRAAMRGER